MLTLPPSRVKRPAITAAPQSVMDSATGKYVTKTLQPGDALLRLGDRQSGLAIIGGTRIIVQGGRITLSQPGPLVNGRWALDSPPGANQLANYRRAMTLNKQDDVDGAIVHVEGLHATGPCLSEGCQSVTPALVQYVYCRFDHLIEQDPTGDTDNHSDAVQAMRADRGVRISWCAAVTDMQGFMLKWQTDLQAKPYRTVEIDNTLFHGGEYGEVLLNLVNGYVGQTRSLFENISVVPSKDKLRAAGGDVEKALATAVMPGGLAVKVTVDNPTGYLLVRWPALESAGTVTQVDLGVYCDPALGSLTPAQRLERHLPASLIGINYKAAA